MKDQNDKIQQLLRQIEELQEQQNRHIKALRYLRDEVGKLHSSDPITPVSASVMPPTKPEPQARMQPEAGTPAYQPTPQMQAAAPVRKQRKALDINFEKFIGENLISKIGILILIFGVAIGAKYSVENNLISPLTRIVLGYVTAIGLLLTGMKLKAKYTSYSAVLVSGAMAIMYVVTFLAYDFYQLFSLEIAFGLMVLFTLFTVIAAISYERQVIALVGLVGAYAVPFLLSNDSGNVAFLFSYMALINIGILAISVRQYWKSVAIVAFALTWLMLSSWLLLENSSGHSLIFEMGFPTLFFCIFYATFLAYKVIKGESFVRSDVVLLLANAFIYFALGYYILQNDTTTEHYLGLFAIANAGVHFLVASYLNKRSNIDVNIFYIAAGLVLVFITLAIPIQLDGNWVTLMWAAEAALVFWLGRTKKIATYETMSYPLIVLAIVSQLQDWGNTDIFTTLGSANNSWLPIANVGFFTALAVIAALAYIAYLHIQTWTLTDQNKGTTKNQLLRYVLPATVLLFVFSLFSHEIAQYWQQRFELSKLTLDGDAYAGPQYDYSMLTLKNIWTSNYAMLFASLLGAAVLKWARSQSLLLVGLFISVFALAAFLVVGLLEVSNLRQDYLHQNPDSYYTPGSIYLYIRYISYPLVGLLLYSMSRLVAAMASHSWIRRAFDVTVALTILWLLSSELLHWMDIAANKDAYKLALTILWGTFALSTVAVGIWKRKKHLRIAAIALFAATLLKLFFYDISNLSTISKTIVLVSLGLLLLIISFLYNKYTSHITDEEDPAA